MSTNPPPAFPGQLDPNLDAAALAQLAQTDQSQWPAILSHPNVYPELTVWIQSQMPQAAPVQAAPYGAVQYGAPVAAGPKPKPVPGSNWPAYVQTGFAVLMIISTFLPIVSIAGMSFGFFSDYGGYDLGVGTGMAMTMIFFALLIGGLAAPLIFVVVPGLRIAAGIIGIIFGLISLIMWFIGLGAANFAGSAGFGIYLGLICSIGVIVSGISLLAVKQRPMP